MIQKPTLEESQNKLLKEFENKFYHRFGIPITITKGDPDELMLNNIKYDSDLLILRRIVNSHIPKELRKETDTIVKNCRKRDIVYLRMAFCKMARERGMTLENIGSICNRKHTTIAYNIKEANYLLERDIKFKSVYNLVKDSLNKYYKINARTNQFFDKTEDNTNTANIIKLYPGEYKDYRKSCTRPTQRTDNITRAGITISKSITA